jgi:membrane fusion protein (multidrug efflux system)
LIIGILAVIGAIWGVIAFLDARHYEATDDAYVNADIVLVASQVKGNLIELDVDDNQRVKAGQLIGRIDPTQYKANLEQANANLAIARAQVEAAKADIELTQRQGDAQIQSATGGASAASGGVGVAQAQIGITAAQLAAAEATESLERTDLDNLDRNVSAAEDALSRATAQAKAADGAVKAAQASAKAAVAQEESAQAAEQYAVRQYDRSQHLFAEDAISQNELDQAKLGLDNAKAAHESAQRQADAASEAVGERASDRDAAWIAVKAAENGVAQAKLQKQEGFDRLNGALAQVNAQKQSLAGAHQGAETAGGSLTRAQADVASAQTLPDKLKQKMAQEALAEAQVQQAEAAVANAKLDLDRTVLRAPASGSLSKCYVEVGDLMQIGSPVVNIVMDEAPSIYANFKETQVAQMKVGLPVDADIDGFPGHTFHGHIDSLSPATGSQFALIPPDNATGNFVKVVQRVPVKIVLKEDALTPKLAIGMSATVRVRVRD